MHPAPPVPLWAALISLTLLQVSRCAQACGMIASEPQIVHEQRDMRPALALLAALVPSCHQDPPPPGDDTPPTWGEFCDLGEGDVPDPCAEGLLCATLIGGAGPGMCSHTCVPDPVKETCEDITGKGTACIDGRCFYSCDVDADCPAETYCNLGRCDAKEPP